MQDQKLTGNFVLMTVPVEAVEESGILNGGLIQITAEEGRLVFEAVSVEDEDIVCDGECEDCPVYETEGDDCPNLNN
ncbi:MAG: hypothetical protein IKJ07_10480 [Clostridia bacterium]|jgi:arginine utilization protein RocB|nr:hypothetical protein [Clostridia bacterium]MBR4033140.1 hypothetical protein [Clostridia bacterium]